MAGPARHAIVASDIIAALVRPPRALIHQGFIAASQPASQPKLRCGLASFALIIAVGGCRHASTPTTPPDLTSAEVDAADRSELDSGGEYFDFIESYRATLVRALLDGTTRHACLMVIRPSFDAEAAVFVDVAREGTGTVVATSFEKSLWSMVLEDIPTEPGVMPVVPVGQEAMLLLRASVRRQRSTAGLTAETTTLVVRACERMVARAGRGRSVRPDASVSFDGTSFYFGATSSDGRVRFARAPPDLDKGTRPYCLTTLGLELHALASAPSGGRQGREARLALLANCILRR